MVEIKLTFKDGGAFDFHTKFEQVKERLQQAVEVSRTHGDGSGGSRAAMNGVDTTNVNLEDLPAYREQSDGPLVAPIAAAVSAQRAVESQPPTRDSAIGSDDGRPRPKPTDNAFSPPDEPPPGYEEAQMAGLQDEMDRRKGSGRM